MQRRVLPATRKQNHRGTARTGFFFRQILPQFFFGKVVYQTSFFMIRLESQHPKKGVVIQQEVSFALATIPCTKKNLEP